MCGTSTIVEYNIVETVYSRLKQYSRYSIVETDITHDLCKIHWIRVTFKQKDQIMNCPSIPNYRSIVENK